MYGGGLRWVVATYPSVYKQIVDTFVVRYIIFICFYLIGPHPAKSIAIGKRCLRVYNISTILLTDEPIYREIVLFHRAYFGPSLSNSGGRCRTLWIVRHRIYEPCTIYRYMTWQAHGALRLAWRVVHITTGRGGGILVRRESGDRSRPPFF